MKPRSRSFPSAAAYNGRRSLCEYGPKAPPQSGPSCHSKPNQRRSSIICVTNSSLKRVESMSSLRSTSVPLFARARSCAVQNVRAWPRCNNPVGDGASLPRYFALRPPSLRFVAARISDFGFKGRFASIHEIRFSKRFARICREPPGQTGQWNGQYLLDFGDVQRCVQRARRTGKIFRRAWCDFRIELRPARRDELADLPARKFFRACNVEQPGALLIHQFPNRARRLAGKNRAAKFVREQIHQDRKST